MPRTACDTPAPYAALTRLHLPVVAGRLVDRQHAVPAGRLSGRVSPVGLGHETAGVEVEHRALPATWRRDQSAHILLVGVGGHAGTARYLLGQLLCWPREHHR